MIRKETKTKNVNFRVTETTLKKLEELSNFYQANNTLVFEFALQILDEKTQKQKNKSKKKTM